MPTLLTTSTSPGLVTTNTTGLSSNGTYSSCDSSTLATLSSQYHTNMTTTNKISNLVVDSTSHLPQIISAPSSPIIESTTTNSNNNNNNITQPLSPNDNV
jgi:hypothetical protein